MKNFSKKSLKKNQVINTKLGSPYAFGPQKIKGEDSRRILSELFEQLLIFDQVVISSDRLNFQLFFLAKQLGINLLEEFIEKRYFKFMIWTPLLMIHKGTQLEDGSIDESTMDETPPLIAGSLIESDIDPEKHANEALKHLGLYSKKRKDLTKKIVKNYIVPQGLEFSKDAVRIVTEGYKNNYFAELNLPNEIEPNKLNLQQRELLLSLGHQLLETVVLAKYNFKSYENYEHFKIVQQNLANIGKAYQISENTSEILKIENIPNLKELFIQEKLDFKSVLKMRHLSSAKYFRKWINNIGENSNGQEVSKEYINEVKGNNTFFEKNKGKFLKSTFMFAVGEALGNIIAGPIVGGAAGLTLSLLDDFWLDNLLKGNKPSMFVDDLRKEIHRADLGPKKK